MSCFYLNMVNVPHHYSWKKRWTFFLVQNALDALQFWTFTFGYPLCIWFLATYLSIEKPWVIDSNYVKQTPLVLINGQISWQILTRSWWFFALNSLGTQREVIFFSLRWYWIILSNVSRQSDVSTSNSSLVIYGSWWIALPQDQYFEAMFQQLVEQDIQDLRYIVCHL